VGGPAAAVVDVASDEQLDEIATVIAETGTPVLVVGKGSNLLVADAGFDGIALVLGDAFADVVIDGTVVQAGGMASLPVLARQSAAAGLTGLEWAVGVPGSVGGGVRMNAGGHGSDIAATLHDVEVVDLATAQRRRMPKERLSLGYRTSDLTEHHVVTAAWFDLQPGDPDACQREIAEIVRWRREHQPGGANAGSVFQNPSEDSAGRLVDAAGAKGLRIGTAQVSEKHANFIQVDEDGSADDVFRLMERVATMVHESSGVCLVPETRLVGFPEWERR
jgi:UDP-N-acetylmuramate dehydrogenase